MRDTRAIAAKKVKKRKGVLGHSKGGKKKWVVDLKQEEENESEKNDDERINEVSPG
jgi:hypothetical protein